MDAQELTRDSVDEMVRNFYDAIEWYDAELSTAHELIRKIDDLSRDHGSRAEFGLQRLAREKVLFQRMNRLRLLADALSVLAIRAGMPRDGLIALAARLSFRPYAGDHFERPSEAVSRTADEAKRLRSLPLADSYAAPSVASAPIANNADFDAVAQLAPGKQNILRALLTLKAVDPAHRVLQKNVVASIDQKAEPSSLNHEFSDLKKGVYLLPTTRSTGCWLSPLGRSAAEWLTANPQL